MVNVQEILRRQALNKEKRGKIILESRLQSECVIWYKNTFPNLQKCLFAVFNEGKNSNYKLAIGLTAGVPDLLFVDRRGMLYGFELKQEGTVHKVKHLMVQARWMMDVLPGKAWFCDSLQAFQKFFIGDKKMLVSPELIYYFCKNCNKLSVSWNEMKSQLDCLKG